MLEAYFELGLDSSKIQWILMLFEVEAFPGASPDRLCQGISHEHSAGTA